MEYMNDNGTIYNPSGYTSNNEETTPIKSPVERKVLENSQYLKGENI